MTMLLAARAHPKMFLACVLWFIVVCYWTWQGMDSLANTIRRDVSMTPVRACPKDASK